jgi:hypothetical protein
MRLETLTQENNKTKFIGFLIIIIFGGLMLVSIDGIDEDELAEILEMDVFGHNEPPDRCAGIPTLTAKEWDKLNDMVQTMSDPADPNARVVDVGQHYNLYLLINGEMGISVPRDMTAQALWDFAWDLIMCNLHVKQ